MIMHCSATVRATPTSAAWVKKSRCCWACVAVANPNISLELDQAYCRFFHADFRYLINVIETAQSGTELFALYWKREPVPRELIMPDARPLVDMKNMPILDDDIIVI